MNLLTKILYARSIMADLPSRYSRRCVYQLVHIYSNSQCTPTGRKRLYTNQEKPNVICFTSISYAKQRTIHVATSSIQKMALFRGKRTFLFLALRERLEQQEEVRSVYD